MSDTATPLKKPRWQIVMRIIIAILCALAFILGGLAFKVGAFFNFVMLAMMAACLIVPLLRLPYLIKKEIFWGFWKAPFAKDNRKYWRQIILRFMFWGLCAVVVLTGVVWPQFGAEDNFAIKAVIWGSLAFMALIALFPKRVGAKPMSIFAGFSIAAMSVILIDSLWPQLTGKGAIEVHSPFEVESYMFHAGHNSLVNYHVAHKSQKHAMDVVTIHKNGQQSDGPLEDLESYACFGQPLTAPVSGEIANVVSDLPDQAIGTTNAKAPAGNHVVIKMDDTHYALLAHMQQGSAVVSAGDRVEIGDKLGLCGNSGNTSFPHLHFQVQRYPDLFAEGGYTYPIKFNGTTRIRGGNVIADDGLFYRRNDKMIPRR